MTFDTIKVDDSVYRIEPEALLARTAHAYARKGGAWTVDAMKDDTRLPRQAVLIASKPFGSGGARQQGRQSCQASSRCRVGGPTALTRQTLSRASPFA